MADPNHFTSQSYAGASSAAVKVPGQYQAQSSRSGALVNGQLIMPPSSADYADVYTSSAFGGYGGQTSFSQRLPPPPPPSSSSQIVSQQHVSQPSRSVGPPVSSTSMNYLVSHGQMVKTAAGSQNLPLVSGQASTIPHSHMNGPNPQFSLTNGMLNTATIQHGHQQQPYINQTVRPLVSQSNSSIPSSTSVPTLPGLQGVPAPKELPKYPLPNAVLALQGTASSFNRPSPASGNSAISSPATSEPHSAKSSRNSSPVPPTQRNDPVEDAVGLISSSLPGVATYPSSQPQTFTSAYTQPPRAAALSDVGGVPPPPVQHPLGPVSMAGVGLPPPLQAQQQQFFPPPGLVSAPPLPPQPPLGDGDHLLQTKRPSVVKDRRHYPQQAAYSALPQAVHQPGVTSGNLPPVQPQWNLRQEHQQMNASYPQPRNEVPTMPSVNSQFDRNNYGVGQLSQRMGGMSTQWNDPIDLLHSRNILPTKPIEPPKIVLPSYDGRTVNCSPDLFRCTLTKIPESQNVLQKARLPLGIVLHPFKDLTQLAVVQCNVIVRCRSCRTYINPFVQFVDQRRWKCNLCFRVNELAEEFQYDPISKTYGDPSRRPEIRSATIEFIAPSEYMLRPPQPAVYLFLLDVSYSATETGYLRSFCEVLLQELDHLPGDTRTRIGFMTYDSTIHFYNLSEGLSQPQMMIVTDIDDVFLPCPDNLLINLNENKGLVKDLLQQLPIQFMDNRSPDSALGAALQAAFMLVSPTGGRVTVMQAGLPNFGPGALKPREDPNLRAGKDVVNLGPANDFYKKLSLDCSGQQVAVDLFLLSSQYCDIATLSCISKFSGGSIHYYPGFHASLNLSQVEKFEQDFKRYLTRKIGFEAVMRIRCTKGLSIHTFHGNFFVRSTDLLSLPNINPDSGFAMQLSIEEPLVERKEACFQAALLYTSSKGERRIRVHTVCLPVTSNVLDVIHSADQQAIATLLCKMAVDRSMTSSLSDARDALINACVDVVMAFRATQSGTHSGVIVSPSVTLLPLYILAILKHVAFRLGTSTKLDERVFAMNQMKTMPLAYLMTYLYPNMYPVHNLDDQNCVMQGDVVVPQPPLLHLSAEKFERSGMFLLDASDRMFLYVYEGVGDQLCQNIFNVSNFNAIPEKLSELPELDNVDSERLRNFINHLQSQRPFHASFVVLKSTSKHKQEFLQLLIEDRTESTFSYYEFLKHLHQLMAK